MLRAALATLCAAASTAASTTAGAIPGTRSSATARAPSGETTLVLPTSTLWERQPRAEVERSGLGFELWPGAQVLAVGELVHSASSEIVHVEQGLFRVSQAELPPRSTTPGREIDRIPLLARLDGQAASGPLDVFLENRQRQKHVLVRTLESARLYAPAPSAVWIRVEEARVDQIALVEAEAVQSSPISAEAVSGTRWLVKPKLTLEEGQSRTLVVRIGGAARPAMKAATGGPFVDVTREAGIESLHLEGPDLQLDIRPTMGPGAALADFDGDGAVDIFLPSGGGREGSTAPRAQLYRNLGGLRFAQISEQAGLATQGAGMGALAADFDGDGDADLLLANYGVCRLFENDGKAHFREISERLPQHGVQRWWTAASAADADGDGDLDLYITAYLLYDESKMPPPEEFERYQREDPMAMLPFAFPGERKLYLENRLIHAGQRGELAFVDRTEEFKLSDETGRGMQAIWWDFDRDGRSDLYLANDVSPNRFWRNEGTGFKDISLGTGLDDPRGSMGLAAGDVDGDLDEDLFVTNWQLESNALYLNNLKHNSPKSRISAFRDVAVQAGLAQASVGVTGWGAQFGDLDLDGDLDLVYANGYTSPDYESTGICVGQPCHWFANDGAGRFTQVRESGALAEPLANRCLLACDFDRDGDLDLLVTANNGPARLLENRIARAENRWLGVRLEAKGANRAAIGAEVELVTEKGTQLRTVRAGEGYLGSNAPELHFGLGKASEIRSVRVRWPDGSTSTHAPVDAGAWNLLRQEP
ncbi:MAG: hypothetical protein RL277_2315 [Planctomycetota bacterium]|jgi:hypothetical protein